MADFSKRIILMGNCVFLILYFFWRHNGVEDFIDDRYGRADDYVLCGFTFSRDQMINLHHMALSLSILFTSCGLIGAWLRSLSLLCIFMAFLVLDILKEIILYKSIQWPVVCMDGAHFVLTLTLMDDLDYLYYIYHSPLDL